MPANVEDAGEADPIVGEGEIIVIKDEEANEIYLKVSQ